ncbi:MAG: IS4 family transposase [Chloroflexi bacterium]|nr:IS4 family transposase [Chloroflexota bacterium]
MAHCNTILSQIVKLVPRHEFEVLANRHHEGRAFRTASRWSQFVTMAMAQLAGRSSLRDIVDNISSQAHRLYHLGSAKLSRSSLSRINEGKPYALYEALFGKLLSRCQGKAPGHDFRFKNPLYSLDATTIDLCLSVFPWADFRTTKGAIKLHVGLNHAGYLPEFVTVTDGKTHDVTVGRALRIPRGSIVAIDRGYNDYGWYNQLTEKGIFFVTRLKSNAHYRVISRRQVLKDKGVTSDQTIEFIGVQTSRKCPIPLRRIGYRDPETGKHYVFLTNHFKLSASTIANIYRSRWQIELFFKWIKQNLRIKSFVGTSKNAVLTQIWIALCVYLILAFIKFQSKLTKSMQQILRLLQLNLFEKRDLMALLRGDPPRDNQLAVNQMALL